MYIKRPQKVTDSSRLNGLGSNLQRYESYFTSDEYLLTTSRIRTVLEHEFLQLEAHPQIPDDLYFSDDE